MITYSLSLSILGTGIDFQGIDADAAAKLLPAYCNATYAVVELAAEIITTATKGPGAKACFNGNNKIDEKIIIDINTNAENVFFTISN